MQIVDRNPYDCPACGSPSSPDRNAEAAKLGWRACHHCGHSFRVGRSE